MNMWFWLIFDLCDKHVYVHNLIVKHDIAFQRHIPFALLTSLSTNTGINSHCYNSPDDFIIRWFLMLLLALECSHHQK